MTAPEDMADRHTRQLARLAELSLTLAEDVHAAALAAPEPQEKARLASAFARLGRALRQSIAWEARLVRERARDLKAAEADAAEAGARTAAQAVRRRQDQVRAGVERQIYCELEPRDAAAWLADLDERLEEEALYDGFTDESVEDHIARLSAGLGLTGEAKHDYTPRTLRPRHPPGPYNIDYGKLLLPDDGEDEDLDDEEDDEDDEPEPSSPVGGGGPPEGGWRGTAAAETSPASPLHPAAQGPPPPEGAESQAAPEPDPPPAPPEPYIPPWERLRPGARWPGSSGY